MEPHATWCKCMVHCSQCCAMPTLVVCMLLLPLESKRFHCGHHYSLNLFASTHHFSIVHRDAVLIFGYPNIRMDIRPPIGVGMEIQKNIRSEFGVDMEMGREVWRWRWRWPYPPPICSDCHPYATLPLICFLNGRLVLIIIITTLP